MKFDSTENIALFIEMLFGSPEWRTLQDKTQVFNRRVSSEVMSRGTHCDEVGAIAEKLCKELGYDGLEAELAHLIGLVHDLGHVTYGHAGEAMSDHILETYDFSDAEKENIYKVREALYGKEYASANRDKTICFEHNENSALQFITLCQRFGYEINEDLVIGIIAHSTGRYKSLPEKLFQQAVRLADKLAYINYDVDDMKRSFVNSEEEKKALQALYDAPLLDPDDNEIKINLSDGRSLTVAEFLELDTHERINILIEESVREAKERMTSRPEDYPDSKYETILTGCNDLIVQMANYQNKIDKATDKEEKKILEEKKKELERELYRRSPILYAAYDIKRRSDDFIRSGKGLSDVSKEDRAVNALSAIKNEDLKNEFVYKSLVILIQEELEKNKGLSIEQIKEKYRTENVSPTFVDFYLDYLKFREEQNNVIKNLPNNTEQLTYPEIYTIINFVGAHSNSQLDYLATKFGLDKKFEEVVLKEVQELLSNEEYYKNYKFTKDGLKKRNEIINKYGAQITLPYGLEEESQYMIHFLDARERAIENGYVVGNSLGEQFRLIDDELESVMKPTIFEEVKSKVEEFDEEQSKSYASLNVRGVEYAKLVDDINRMIEESIRHADTYDTGIKR